MSFAFRFDARLPCQDTKRKETHTLYTTLLELLCTGSHRSNRKVYVCHRGDGRLRNAKSKACFSRMVRDRDRDFVFRTERRRSVAWLLDSDSSNLAIEHRDPSPPLTGLWR
jgi:hypothetical protein